MSIMRRLDPEFSSAVAMSPIRDLRDLPRARAVFAEMKAGEPKPPLDPTIQRSDHRAPGRDGHPGVRLRCFRPIDSTGGLPAIYWIQGGGYVQLGIDLSDAWCESLSKELQCAVLSVEWRRAPEHPFPAAIEDCYTGLAWTVMNSADLGLDADRIVISGVSSGGGKAACLALLVRDRADFEICHQLLIQPMLDDRNSTPSSYVVTDPQVWNRTSNEVAWRAYLGEAYGTDLVSPYAAPARMEDLTGVAPTTMFTSELDLFVDEDITYAQRLIQAGVPTELHVYPRVPHGFFQLVPTAAVSRQFMETRNKVLQRVLFEPGA